MDVRSAVKEQANYPAIVAWFRAQGELNLDQLVLLTEVLDGVSDQIYEHYRALCDMLKKELQRIRRLCRENGCEAVFPEESARERAAYVTEAACRLGAVLPEKYEELLKALHRQQGGETYAEKELQQGIV